MSEFVVKLFQDGGGQFVTPPSVFTDKLKKIKAILLDWDGVFNDGFKRGTEGSIFSEVDAMGTNMLRYAFWKRDGKLPVTAIITGENNPSAQVLAQRERFHDLFFLTKNKAVVFDSFCKKHGLHADEVMFFFDDVLDLEVARLCGLRILIGRSASPMLSQYARENSLADYITGHHGGSHGLRESCELTVGLMGLFDIVIKGRSQFSDNYKAYLADRQKIETSAQQSPQP